MFGKREIVLLLAGLVILVTVVWREQQLQHWKSDPTRQIAMVRTLAPRFTLADHNRKVVKFERLLGRHRVILAFFDPELGVDRDPRTQQLIENFDAMHRAGIEIVAVSTATPYANGEAERRLGRKLPFPVVTDIDINDPAPLPTHRKFGLIDAQTGEARTGLFLIERDGSLPRQENGLPLPVQDEVAALATLASGEWPVQTEQSSEIPQRVE